MPKIRLSLPITGAGQNSPKYLDFISASVTGDSSLSITPVPLLFGSTGLHLSIHPSGVKHIRTTQPFLSKSIEGFEKAFTNREHLKGFFDAFAFEPPPGYEAIVLISRDPRRFVSRVAASRFVIDFSGFGSSTVAIRIQDTANLSAVLTMLKAEGWFSEDSFVMVTIPELGAYSIFKPATIDSKIVGTSSRGLRLASDYGGFLGPPTGEMKTKFAQTVISSPLFQPIAKPMIEMIEELDEADAFPVIRPELSLVVSRGFGPLGRQLERQLENPVKVF